MKRADITDKCYSADEVPPENGVLAFADPRLRRLETPLLENSAARTVSLTTPGLRTQKKTRSQWTSGPALLLFSTCPMRIFLFCLALILAVATLLPGCSSGPSPEQRTREQREAAETEKKQSNFFSSPPPKGQLQ